MYDRLWKSSSHRDGSNYRIADDKHEWKDRASHQIRIKESILPWYIIYFILLYHFIPNYQDILHWFLTIEVSARNTDGIFETYLFIYLLPFQEFWRFTRDSVINFLGTENIFSPWRNVILLVVQCRYPFFRSLFLRAFPIHWSISASRIAIRFGDISKSSSGCKHLLEYGNAASREAFPVVRRACNQDKNAVRTWELRSRCLTRRICLTMSNAKQMKSAILLPLAHKNAYC